MRVTNCIFFLVISLYACESSKNGELMPDDNLLESTAQQTKTDNLLDSDNSTSVDYCGTGHYHYVDIAAKDKIDSLMSIGIKQILFYRNWLGTNGFNGYGKLLWTQNEKYYQYQFNFENYNGRYGMRSIDKSESQTFESLDFYIKERIDTVSTALKEPLYMMSHDADHFVYTNIDAAENCFNVSGLELRADSNHVKSQLINLLKIPSKEYYKMLEEKK